MKCDHLSPSLIDKFEQCPLAYWHRYENKTRPAPTFRRPLEFGSFIHKFLELYYEKGYHRVPTKNLDKAFDRIFIKTQEEYNNVPTELIISAKALLKTYLKNTIHPTANKILTEVKFPDGYTLNGIPLSGYIDRVDFYDDKIIITDYKTGNMEYTIEEVTHNPQLLVYACFVRDHFKINLPIHLRYDMVSKGYYSPTYIPSSDEMDTMVERLPIIMDKIHASKGEPSASWLCSWCDYKNHCDIYTEWQSDMGIEIPDEIEDAGFDKIMENIDILTIQEKIVTDRKKTLRKLVISIMQLNELETIDHGQWKVKITRKKTHNYNPLIVAQHIPDALFDGVFKVQTTNLNAIISKLPDDARTAIFAADSPYYSSPYPTITKKKVK